MSNTPSQDTFSIDAWKHVQPKEAKTKVWLSIQDKLEEVPSHTTNVWLKPAMVMGLLGLFILSSNYFHQQRRQYEQVNTYLEQLLIYSEFESAGDDNEVSPIYIEGVEL